MKKSRIVLNLFLVISLVFLGCAVIYSKLNIKAAAATTGLMRKSDSRLRFNGYTVGYEHDFPEGTHFYAEEFWYKEDVNDNSYICASGLNVLRPEDVTCELVSTGDSEIGLAYIINSISGKDGGVASLKTADVGYTRYYWMELLALRYLGNLPDSGENPKSVSAEMKNNVINGSYKLPNGKTFSQTMTEAQAYQNKYKNPINFSLDASTLVFDKRQNDNSPITSNICINDINGNIDSLSVKANNNDFEVSDLTTDSKGRKCFYVKIPSGKVDTIGEQVTVTVTASNKYYKASYYQCTGSNIQDLIATTTEEKKNNKEISISGSLKYPTITVNKVDEFGNNLAGAKMSIKCTSGSCMGSFQQQTFETTSTPKVFTGSTLLAGTYEIEELAAPAGHVLPSENDRKKSVTVNACSSSTSCNQNLSVSFTNNSTKVTISKKDITGKDELPGATLKISKVTNSSKETIKSCRAYIEDESKLKYLENCTWQSGEKPATIVGLSAGSYYLEETIAPDGYKKNTKGIYFNVSDTGVSSNVTMTNELTEVEISKRLLMPNQEFDGTFGPDDTDLGIEVPGAKLRILDSNQKKISCKIKNGSDIQELKDCTWDFKTTTTIVGLSSGTYYLEEISAPDGYQKNSQLVKFIIDKNGNVSSTVVMYNKYTEVKISKQNSVDNKELPGATLSILDENKEKMSCKIMYDDNTIEELEECTWVSRKKPVTIYGLLNGTYYLKEEKAPEGYEQYEDLIEFSVPDTPPEVVMTDVLSVPVPDTLSSRSTILLSMAMIDIAIGIGILIYAKKNRFQK